MSKKKILFFENFHIILVYYFWYKCKRGPKPKFPCKTDQTFFQKLSNLASYTEKNVFGHKRCVFDEEQLILKNKPSLFN